MSARVRSSNAASAASSAEQQAQSLRAFIDAAFTGHERVAVPRHPTLASPPAQRPPPGMSRPPPSAQAAGAPHRLRPRGVQQSTHHTTSDDEGGPQRPESPPDPSVFLDEAAELITLHGVGTHKRNKKSRPQLTSKDDVGTRRRSEAERRRERGRQQVAAAKRQRAAAAKRTSAAQAEAVLRRKQALQSLHATQRRAVRGPAHSGSKAANDARRTASRVVIGGGPNTTGTQEPEHGNRQLPPSQEDLYMQWMGVQSQGGASAPKHPPLDLRSGSPSAFVSPTHGGFAEHRSVLPSSSELRRSFVHPHGSPSPEQKSEHSASRASAESPLGPVVPQLPLASLEAGGGSAPVPPPSSLTTGGGWRVMSPATSGSDSGSGGRGGAGAGDATPPAHPIDTSDRRAGYGPTSARSGASDAQRSSRSGTAPLSTGRGGGHEAPLDTDCPPPAPEQAPHYTASAGGSTHEADNAMGTSSVDSQHESKGSRTPPDGHSEGGAGGVGDTHDLHHTIRDLQAQVRSLAAQRDVARRPPPSPPMPPPPSLTLCWQWRESCLALQALRSRWREMQV